MPRPKTRNKTREYIDIALKVKLNNYKKLWEITFGESLSEIEISKLFGEFGNMDITLVKRYRDKDG